MQGPFDATGQALEAAGAAILQRASISTIGIHLETAADQLALLATLIPQLDASASLAGQRMAACAEKMTLAGQELQGIQPEAPKGKSWIKGGGGGLR